MSGVPVIADVWESCSIRMGYPRYPKCSRHLWTPRYADNLQSRTIKDEGCYGSHAGMWSI